MDEIKCCASLKIMLKQAVAGQVACQEWGQINFFNICNTL